MVLSCVAIAGKQTSERWQEKSTWGKLKVGMTEQGVGRLLGEPKHKKASRSACMWYYQDIPTEENKRPSFGIIHFRRSTTNESFAAHKWAEPDWQRVQADIETLRLQQEAEAEQARLEKEHELAQRRLEAEQREIEQAKQRERRLKETEAEREKRRQEQTEAQAKRQKHMTELRAKREREQAELRSVKPTGFASKYFIIIGVVFLGMAAAITFFVKGVGGRWK